ncbi:MAG: hypothetical protein ACI4OJ_10545 [Lachnospiraceae bacterium]
MMWAHGAGLLLALCWLTFFPALPVKASPPVYALSARVYWEEAGQQKPALSDLYGIGSKWQIKGSELVFLGTPAPGETTKLFQGVTIPAGWGNEHAGDALLLVVEATLREVSESPDGNVPCRLVIEEIQDDGTFEEVSSVSEKTVLPGEQIKKTVQIRIGNAAKENPRKETAAGKAETSKAMVIPLDGSAPAALPTAGGLPAIQRSLSSAIGAVRSAKTGDFWHPLLQTAGIFTGGIVLAIWLLHKRRR